MVFFPSKVLVSHVGLDLPFCLVQIRGIWFVGIQESSKQYTPVANGDMHRMGSVFLCLFFFGG